MLFFTYGSLWSLLNGIIKGALESLRTDRQGVKSLQALIFEAKLDMVRFP